MTYEHCQSCGMPLSKDPGGGGTEADGSKRATDFSKCYGAGKSFRRRLRRRPARS